MILCYHDVDDSWSSRLAIDPGRFAAHCRWLSGTGRVVSLQDLLADHPVEQVARSRSIALTFDDGLAGLHEHALPVLLQYSIPATVYVVAGTLSRNPVPVDWIDGVAADRVKALERAQLQELLDCGVELGSHTWRHDDLTQLANDDCLEDLRRSKDMLEQMFQIPVPTLAYPRGRNNQMVRELVQEAGYSYGLSLPEQHETVDRWAVPRTGVWSSNGRLALALKSDPRFFQFRTGRAYPILRSIPRQFYRLLGR